MFRTFSFFFFPFQNVKRNATILLAVSGKADKKLPRFATNLSSDLSLSLSHTIIEILVLSMLIDERMLMKNMSDL